MPGAKARSNDWNNADKSVKRADWLRCLEAERASVRVRARE